jgi:transcriptional regulator with XRE-family HTH domain
METVGERLRWARQRRAWSQADLAERSGVPIGTISRTENNRFGGPKPSTVRKLAVALDIDPAWLVYGFLPLAEPWSTRYEREPQTLRERLRRLVNDLPESELHTAERFLEHLTEVAGSHQAWGSKE